MELCKNLHHHEVISVYGTIKNTNGSSQGSSVFDVMSC